jgi:uncharacterized RDD family membrane protein YckC
MRRERTNRLPCNGANIRSPTATLLYSPHMASYSPGTLYCAECGRPTPPDELARFGELLICPDCKNNYAQKLREGVATQPTVEYGGFWIRFVAVIIDGIILGVVSIVINFALFGSMFNFPTPGTSVPPEAMLSSMLGRIGLSWLINTAIACSYETFFLGKFGATPGKMALSLRVVRPDGSPVSYGRAAGRYFGKMLSSMTLLIGYIIAGFDSQKRALHDMICDTRVIRMRN